MSSEWGSELGEQLIEIECEPGTDIRPGENMQYTMMGAYCGMFVVITAFALETRGQISSRSIGYLAGMALGQILLGIRAWHTGEWPFAILAAIWAGIALLAIAKPSDSEVEDSQ